MARKVRPNFSIKITFEEMEHPTPSMIKGWTHNPGTYESTLRMDTRATPAQVKRALKYLGYAAFDFYYDHINRG